MRRALTRWGTIAVFFVLIGGLGFYIYRLESNKYRQLNRYCELTGGHMYRYKAGPYVSSTSSRIGDSTVDIPYTQEVWADGIRLPDGTEITQTELIQRGAINPSDDNYVVKPL